MEEITRFVNSIDKEVANENNRQILRVVETGFFTIQNQPDIDLKDKILEEVEPMIYTIYHWNLIRHISSGTDTVLVGCENLAKKERVIFGTVPWL